MYGRVYKVTSFFSYPTQYFLSHSLLIYCSPKNDIVFTRLVNKNKNQFRRNSRDTNCKTMSKQNLVSAEITEAVKSDIQTNISNINAALPFLLALSNEDRKGGLKLGDKTVAFIDKALDYAGSNPSLVPPYVNLAEVQKDYQLQKALIDVQQWMASLLQKIEDTRQEAGAEAYNGILGFYQAVRVAAEKNVPGARAIYEDLSKRFPGTRKPKNLPLPDKNP